MNQSRHGAAKEEEAPMHSSPFVIAKSQFERVLERIKSESQNPHQQGRFFEKLIQTYLQQHPFYQTRFSKVMLWDDWPLRQGPDTGIDIVAKKTDGSYCAIQCKFYGSSTHLDKASINSFLAESSQKQFTERILVYTGSSLGPHLKKIIDNAHPACKVIDFGELANDRCIRWSDHPEELRYEAHPHRLRDHQQLAFDDVIKTLETHDRCRMIMPCGTGKTLTALRIAEHQAGKNGRILYLVPSIALLNQTLQAFTEEKRSSQYYVGVCSDQTIGKSGAGSSEDMNPRDIPIPISTRAKEIFQSIQEDTPPETMTVVLSTYQSLPRIAEAQHHGAPIFDLIIADEAHRTTGLEGAQKTSSPFLLVHDNQRIRAKKRLYMTATPRVYGEKIKTRAKERELAAISMDDEEIYGPEAHRLTFSAAIEQNILADYKVLVCGAPTDEARRVHHIISRDGSKLELAEIVKILACWRALQGLFDSDVADHSPDENQNTPAANPRRKTLTHHHKKLPITIANPRGENDPLRPGAPARYMHRAIAFHNTIAASKRYQNEWERVVQTALKLANLPLEQALNCQVKHVDGKTPARQRKADIRWLGGLTENSCRILSNARCLTEGVDVPTLDAVLFLEPRKSKIDVIQAVGRAIRQSAEKSYGYVILPIYCPPDQTPEQALDDNETHQVVWEVLNALRSHDDRLDTKINRLNLRSEKSEPSESSEEKDSDFDQTSLIEYVDKFYVKAAKKCGDLLYYEHWGQKVANIVPTLRGLMDSLLAQETTELQPAFDAFVEELQREINQSINAKQAVELIAQHLITGPVFNALFADYRFTYSNPVARGLNAMVERFKHLGLSNETQKLTPFYQDVTRRIQGMSSQQRQTLLKKLYEVFFQKAFAKDAERLGIVYTPDEVVDFILHSANHAMRETFGCGLTDENVHIIDPFTGTGTFITRLLQANLIADADLPRKFASELHTNEIMLLAYYIATVNIEQAYHARRGENTPYQAFPGAVFCDTFNLGTDTTQLDLKLLKDNDERRQRQQKTPITVIVGNPPYSAGQRSADDNNPNVFYPHMAQRIRETYAARSTVTNRNSLYDSYKMALRWASDRIEDKGVIAFVTNASFIDGNADDGLRACLAEEFTSIYCYHLRGNARLAGESFRKEGGKIFGQGSRAPIAITVLIKDPQAKEKCIFFKDIGDYLSREQKLDRLRHARSIARIEDWKQIEPDAKHSWIHQGSPAYQKLLPLGTQETKAGRANEALFSLYSNGLKSGRDPWLYNFSREGLARQTAKMSAAYARVLARTKAVGVDAAIAEEELKINWDREIRNLLKREKAAPDLPGRNRIAIHRPFVKQWLAFNRPYVQMSYQIPRIFPEASSENRVICVDGPGSKGAFSCLMVDATPDLGLMAASQCFPLYRYDALPVRQGSLVGAAGFQRRDNILDASLLRFRQHYGDESIGKEDIFYYVYGVLHAPAYRALYANDLRRELPRVPFAPDFWAFAGSGRALGGQHVGYESADAYPLTLSSADAALAPAQRYRLGKKMKLERGRDGALSVLRINEHCCLSGIPAEAQDYVVNGRTPLEWLIDRYRIPSTGDASGVLKDPNAWFADDPAGLLRLIGQVVQVSVDTARMVRRLPSPFERI